MSELTPEQNRSLEESRERAAGCFDRPEPDAAEYDPGYDPDTHVAPIAALRPRPPLSQSRQAKMACPHLYVQAEVVGVEMPDSVYSIRGIQIHAAIQDYLNHLVATKQPSDWTFFEKILERGYGVEALGILDRMKESLIIDPERVLFVEPYLGLDENLEPVEVDPFAPSHLLQKQPPGGVHFAGIPDYGQAPDPRTVECWDWKSWFQVVEPDTFQSEFYPLLIFKHYPLVEVVRFHLHFVRYGVSRSIEFTRADDLPRLEKRARQERRRQLALHADAELAGSDVKELRMLVRDDLAAMPGPHCVYCPLLDKGCPIAQLNPYALATNEERLRFIVWAQQAVKSNATVLREFVKAGGAVEMRDSNGNVHRAEYALTETKVIPLEAGYQALVKWKEQTGEDLIVRARVGSTEIAPLLNTKKRSTLKETIDAITANKTGSKWKIGRVGDDEEPF